VDRPAAASHWVKSSFSFANGNCVEVADLPDGRIGVRNSRDPEGPVLRFTSDEWQAFLGGVRRGEFGSFGKQLAGRVRRVGAWCRGQMMPTQPRGRKQATRIGDWNEWT
jgi:predicted secreted Zn-dependent protease